MKEIVSRVTRRNTNNQSNLPLTISAQDGLIDQNTYFNKQVASKDMSNYYLLVNGDFAYNKSYSNGYPMGTIKRLDKYKSGALSSLYIVFRPEQVNSDFLTFYYETNKWYREVAKMSSEGARNHGLLNIPVNSFFEKKLIIPDNYNEQITISKFLWNLQNVINLHQRKINMLIQLKKAILREMFADNMNNTPNLRFYGFNKEWEQRKLVEISFKVSEKNKSNLITETLTNSAEYGIINQREYFSKDISNEKNLENYYVVKPDDFVYNPRISIQAPVGPINRNKLERVGVMSPLYYVFRLSNEMNYDYLEYYFQSTKWHRFMKLNGDSGARSDRFSIKNTVLVTMPIPLPDITEQNSIGQFFIQLNKSIHLHQRKLNQLEKLKSLYLQKMFL